MSMEKGDFESRKGFTIIEVALVLAIAGLIFLMVFIALPAVQRTQRDAERREDLSTLLAAIKKYQTNNRGALPVETGTVTSESAQDAANSTWGGFYREYLDEDFTDPSGDSYELNVSACASSTGQVCLENTGHNLGVIRIVTGAGCDDNNHAVRAENPRRVAALIKLEAGDTVFCADK